MSQILGGLYGQAGSRLENFDNEFPSDCHGGTLSVGSLSSSHASSDAEDSSDGAHYDRSRAVKAVTSDTRQHLVRCLSRSGDVIAKLDQLVSRYTENGLCHISGVSKFRGRVLTEAENLRTALTSIEGLDDSEATSAALAGAHLLARCNGIAHYDFIMRLAACEPDVTGLLVSIGANGPSSARHALEVDLCTCNGLRWIKARTSRTSSLHADGAEIADPKYVSQIRELCYRARHTAMPFAHHPQVAVVFKAPPPQSLMDALQAHGAHVCALPESGRLSLPARELSPCFVCLDTTTLVAMCSFTAFTSAEDYPVERCLHQLDAYKVLSEQVRQEQADPVVSGHIDPALARLTTWTTRRQAASTLARELVSRTIALSDHGDELHTDPTLRPDASLQRAFALSVPDAHTWIDALLPTDLTLADVVSCAAVRQTDLERQRRAVELTAGGVTADAVDAPTPNWVIADITLQEFRWMIETLAGPEEILRAAEVLRNVMVVDTTHLRGARSSATAIVTPLQHVKAGGRLLARNKVVFGMADAIGAVLLTSNRQVVNTAKERGITLLIVLHPSRSLTEQKIKVLPRRSGPSKLPPFHYEEDAVSGSARK